MKCYLFPIWFTTTITWPASLKKNLKLTMNWSQFRFVIRGSHINCGKSKIQSQPHTLLNFRLCVRQHVTQFASRLFLKMQYVQTAVNNIILNCALNSSTHRILSPPAYVESEQHTYTPLDLVTNAHLLYFTQFHTFSMNW